MGSHAVNDLPTKKPAYIPTLRTTPEVRKAFDELGFRENFLESSETILKYMSSGLSALEDKDALSEDTKYVIRRLVSSLASKRNYARHGAYTTLQAILQLHSEILPYTRSYVEEFLESNQEDDYIFGQILACGAMIRSGCCIEEPSYVKSMVKKLIALSKDKSYYDQIVGHFLVNFLVMYDNPNTAQMLWGELQSKIQKPLEELSPSLLWLRFIFSRDEYLNILPDVKPNFQEKTYGPTSFSIVASAFENLSSGNVNITMMVEDYLKSLLSYQNESTSGADHVAKFFSNGLNPLLKLSFFQNNDSSISKVIFNFNIAQMTLPHLTTKDHFEKVLSTTLLELIITSKSMKSEPVNASARGLMAAILQQIIKNKENGSEAQFAIFKQLISTSASLKFDKYTGTTLLHQAYENFNLVTIKSLSKLFSSRLQDEANDEMLQKATPYSKELPDLILTAQWLCWLVCHNDLATMDHNAKWKAEQVVTLLKFTFFKKHSEQNKNHLTSLYLRALNQNMKKLQDQLVMVELIIKKAVSYYNKFPHKCILDEAAQSCFVRVSKQIECLKESEGKLTEKDSLVFRLLYGHMILHLFANPESSMELIDEVDLCYKKASKTSSKKRKVSTKIDSEAEPAWGEVIVDLLLGILASKEGFWRKFIANIFRCICPDLSPSSLSLLTDIIDPKKKDKVMCDDDEEMGSDQEESDGEEEEDEEEQETDEDDDDDDDEEEEEDDEEEEEEGEENEKAAKLAELRLEMQKLAGIPTDNIELDSVPEDELNNLDAQLGALMGKFISISKKKKGVSRKQLKDETTLMHFRVRVCDLFEVLIEEAPSLSHLLPLMHPLILALDKTSKDEGQRTLCNKLRSVLLALTKVKKFANSEDVNAQVLVKELEFVFALAYKVSSRVSKEVGQCIVFLLRSSLRSSAEESSSVDEVFQAYSKYIEHVMKKSNMEIPESSLTLNTGSLSCVLDTLLKVTFQGSTRPFRKKQGLGMMKLIMLNAGAMSKMPASFIKEFYRKLNAKIVHEFDSVLSTKNVQSAFLVSIIQFLKAIKLGHKSDSCPESNLNWSQIGTSLSSLEARVDLAGFKELKQTFKKVTHLFNLQRESSGNSDRSQEKKLKRKAAQEEDGAPNPEANPPKKLKKKSKRKREQVPSDAKAEDIPSNDAEVEERSKKKKKADKSKKKKSVVVTSEEVLESEPAAPSQLENSMTKKKKKKSKDKSEKMSG